MTLLATNVFVRLLEAVYGGQSTGSGQGQESTLDWNSPWTAGITLGLLIAVAIYVIVIYAREYSSRGPLWRVLLAGLRIALVALVVFMFYRLVMRPYKTDLPDVVIILDESESMRFPDPYHDSQLAEQIQRRLRDAGFQQATRLNLAKTLLLENKGELLASLQKKYNLKFYLVGDTARSIGGEDESPDVAAQLRAVTAEKQSSRLGKTLLDVLHAQRGRPTAAIILLTDGITTEGKTISDAAAVARRKSIPLFTIGLGSEKPLRDVWLADLLADEVAFVGDTVTFELKVAGNGYENEPVDVRLIDKQTGRQVDRTRVTLPGDGRPTSGRLQLKPDKPGDFEYLVEIVSPPGESNPQNNTQLHVLKVRDETIRVLLVQAYPNYEFRYLKNLLTRQLKKSNELTTVLQYADPDYAALDETARRVFPVRRDELFEYDVLIFGDVNPSFLSLSVMENISAFIKQRGGGVIFMAGPRYTPLAYRGTPLADLLPVNLDLASVPDPRQVLVDAHVVQPTSLGLTSPHMQLGDSPLESLERWQKLPGLYWFLQAPELKPGARVLAEHPGLSGPDGRKLPVIVLQYVGAGKVIFHGTDETWRWRFRIGDALFGRYWMQTIRYLSRSKLLGKARSAEVTADRETYRRGEPVRLRVRFLDDRAAPPQDDGVTVVLEQTAGRSRRVTLERSGERGIFETTLTNLPPGRYRAWMASPTLADGAPATDFTIEDPGGERARLQMDEKDLRLAAQKTDGQYFTFATADRLLSQLPEGRQVPIEAMDPVSVWNSHLLALLFVGLLVTEWLLRKWVGML